jgi:hypothetical protein
MPAETARPRPLRRPAPSLRPGKAEAASKRHAESDDLHAAPDAVHPRHGRSESGDMRDPDTHGKAGSAITATLRGHRGQRIIMRAGVARSSACMSGRRNHASRRVLISYNDRVGSCPGFSTTEFSRCGEQHDLSRRWGRRGGPRERTQASRVIGSNAWSGEPLTPGRASGPIGRRI